MIWAGHSGKDKWLQSTFSGLNAAHQMIERDWNQANIKPNADTIKEMFPKHKHIFEIDPYKVYPNLNATQGWKIDQYFIDNFFYPNKELGDHAIVVLMRGIPNDDYIFERNELGGDGCFVATNSEKDATIIALKYR